MHRGPKPLTDDRLTALRPRQLASESGKGIVTV